MYGFSIWAIHLHGIIFTAVIIVFVLLLFGGSRTRFGRWIERCWFFPCELAFGIYESFDRPTNEPGVSLLDSMRRRCWRVKE